MKLKKQFKNFTRLSSLAIIIIFFSVIGYSADVSLKKDSNNSDKFVNIKVECSPTYIQRINSYYYDNSWKEHKQKSSDYKSSIKKDDLKLISYNVWGAPQDESSKYFNFKLRSRAILDILEKENADIVFLQEVSEKWLKVLLNSEFIRNNYFISENKPNRINSTFGLGQIILSKLPLENVNIFGLPGYEMYTLLSAEINHNEDKIQLNNVHLHSCKHHHQFRIAQLKTIFNIIDKSRVTNQIIAGDFNFGDEWKENKCIRDCYADAWLKINKNLKGFTEDTEINRMRFMFKKKNKQERFDRILYSGKINPKDIRIIGTHSVNKEKTIWPSDHFGLSCRFSH